MVIWIAIYEEPLDLIVFVLKKIIELLFEAQLNSINKIIVVYLELS